MLISKSLGSTLKNAVRNKSGVKWLSCLVLSNCQELQLCVGFFPILRIDFFFLYFVHLLELFVRKQVLKLIILSIQPCNQWRKLVQFIKVWYIQNSYFNLIFLYDFPGCAYFNFWCHVK